jgi:hypothetical protein
MRLTVSESVLPLLEFGLCFAGLPEKEEEFHAKPAKNAKEGRKRDQSAQATLS